MPHFFYDYKVFTDMHGVERTILKWFVDSEYATTEKIDKPTSELTEDELQIIAHFFEDGGVPKDKTEIDLPPDNPSSDM
jgi:hypothetical protein